MGLGDFHLARARKRNWPRWLRIAVKALIVLLLLPYILTLVYAVVPPVSTLMLWRWATFQRVERDWTPIAEISPALRLAVIVAEDGRFCTHSGIDLHEIQASIADAESLDELRGSSTITQQVAKNLFLWNGRSFVRKALEVPISFWMSLVMTKKRVLEIYLNIAEWGPDGEFGAEAAARRAFGRSADEVSGYQAALLAASLPNPHKRNAKSPGPGLRRLAGTYVARAQSAPEADDCLGLERRRTP